MLGNWQYCITILFAFALWELLWVCMMQAHNYDFCIILQPIWSLHNVYTLAHIVGLTRSFVRIAPTGKINYWCNLTQLTWTQVFTATVAFSFTEGESHIQSTDFGWSVPLTYCESLRMAFAMEMCAALNPPQKFSEVGSAETPSFALSLRWTSTATLWKRLGPWLMTLKRRWLWWQRAGGERPRLLL